MRFRASVARKRYFLSFSMAETLKPLHIHIKTRCDGTKPISDMIFIKNNHLRTIPYIFRVSDVKTV